MKALKVFFFLHSGKSVRNISLFHGTFTDRVAISFFEGCISNFGHVLLQHVALLVPAGPAEGDTFPDPNNARGVRVTIERGGQ